MDLEHKTLPSGGVMSTNDEGIVEALVSVTGIKDNVNDIIIPGAYAKTLTERTPKGVWSHDWNNPVSKVVDIKELMPGDPSLPQTLANGTPWPAEAGGLYVKTQFNLNTQAGKDAYENVKFFGENAEWSIGYKVPKGEATVDKTTGTRHIKSLNLYEFSPVLFGAASDARSLVTSIKSLFADEEEWRKAVTEATEEKSDEPTTDAEHVEVAENHPETIVAEDESTVQEPSDEDLIKILTSVDEEAEGEAPDAVTGEKSEERSEPREVKLSAVVLERLQSLQDEIKAVLDIALGVETEQIDLEIPTKSLDEATEDLLNADVDIDHKTLVGVVKLGRTSDDEERKELAIKILDSIDVALDSADEKQELLLKTLAKSIGDSFELSVTPEPVEETDEEIEDEKAEEVEPEVKSVTLNAADFAAEFKNFIK